MAFTAKLHLDVESVSWPVLDYHWAVVQAITEQSRPENSIFAGQLHLVLDHLHHPLLDAWMSDATKRRNGRLEVTSTDGRRLRTVAFWDAYCVSEGLYFNSTGVGRATTMSVLISANRLLIDEEVEITNHWPHL
ncbi:type VI secretion system tube protein TssD [Hymenobacter terrenus]|uniref:type VI secretion system tube protein TssD n=1 Tax=Hymenobacter terrenus TaxID=1629124 RepID=UPI000619F055|nr:type VI secretion system tube protein TssD [Hymenobacter terrenus]